jgi:hypothetical protein
MPLLLLEEFLIMFKKVYSLLLLLFLVCGCMGCVCATHYYDDGYIEVGDVFHRYDYEKMINVQYYFNEWDVLSAAQESGLCKELEYYTDMNGFHQWKYLAEKVGSYTYTVVHWYCDDDYYTFHVNPHPMVLNSYFDPFIGSDGLLHGNVNPRAANPDKSHPDYFEFNNSCYLVTCYSNTSNFWYQKVFNTADTPASRAGSSNNGYFEFSDLDLHLEDNESYFLKVDLIPRGNWSTASKTWNFNT